MKGDDNCVADALSPVDFALMSLVVAPVLSVSLDCQLLWEIKRDYRWDE